MGNQADSTSDLIMKDLILAIVSPCTYKRMKGFKGDIKLISSSKKINLNDEVLTSSVRLIQDFFTLLWVFTLGLYMQLIENKVFK